MGIKKEELTAIVIGSGRLGASLALHLNKCGFAVTIIDRDDKAFRKLDPGFSGFMVGGDATNCETLEDVGIKKADYVVSVTQKDNTNILVGLIAKNIYKVPNVYVRLADNTKEKLVENCGLKTIFPFKLSMAEFERQSGIISGGEGGGII